MNLSHRELAALLFTAILCAGCQSTLSTTTPMDTALPSLSLSPTRTPLLPTTTPVPAVSPTNSRTPTVPSRPTSGEFTTIFVGETIPDATNFWPGEAFRKSWTMQNGGMRAWTEQFTLAITASDPEGEHLGSPESVPLGRVVQPGERTEISVDLHAPQRDGRYTVYYELKDDTGAPVLDSQIWVTITVGAAGSAPAGSTSVNGISAIMAGFTHDAQSGTVFFCMTVPNRYYALGPSCSVFAHRSKASALP
jgi:hypothetical protein